MKNFVLFIILWGLINPVFCQEKIFSIDNKDYFLDDMIAMLYPKDNPSISIQDITVKDFNKFFTYHLKIFDAKKKQIDRSKKFVTEFERSKQKIIENYISDHYISDEEVAIHYDRSSKLLKFKIISLSPVNKITERKIKEIKRQLDEGKDFDRFLYQYSFFSIKGEDNKKIKDNFKCFTREAVFDDAVFSLNVNEISDIIKTSNAYCIVQLLEIKPNPGKIKVAQILAEDKKGNEDDKPKRKIDSLYQLLMTGEEDFGKIASMASEDRSSARYGGMMPWMGKGDFISEFEDVAFSLKNNGDISNVFKTRLGWHILQRIEYKKELYTKKEIRDILAARHLSNPNFLITLYEFSENSENIKKLRNYSEEDFDKILFTIDSQSYTIKDFQQYKNAKGYGRSFKQNHRIYSLFSANKFSEYHVSKIISNNPKLKKSLDNMYNNHLYYLVQNERIWKNTIFESKTYFENNKADYIKKYGKNVSYEKIADKVRSDYTNFLNNQWVVELISTYKIDIYIPRFKNNNPIFND